MARYKVGDIVHEGSHVYNLYYHIVWATKYRHEIFTEFDLVEEMENLLYQIAERNNLDIEYLGVLPDHIHLLASFNPSTCISKAVKNLKGASARYFLQNHPELTAEKLRSGHLWAKGYYAGTLGNMSQVTIRKYIERQYLED